MPKTFVVPICLVVHADDPEAAVMQVVRSMRNACCPDAMPTWELLQQPDTHGVVEVIEVEPTYPVVFETDVAELLSQPGGITHFVEP